MPIRLKNSSDSNDPRKRKEKLTAQQFLAKYEDALPTTAEGQYIAKCPCHVDNTASLSICIDGEQVLMKCHAGCETKDVLKWAGLKMSDLYLASSTARPAKLKLRKAKPASVDDSTASKEAGKRRRRIVSIHPYLDADGQQRYQKLKYEPKSFAFRRPDGSGGWVYDMLGIDLILYRLSELLVADPDWPVFIVEGEKDVDRLRSLETVIATCNADGAGKWRDDYNEFFAGRHVVIVPDNDDPGRSHAQLVARSLSGVAASIRVLKLDGLPEKGDVSDWLDAGHTADELLELALQVEEWEFSESEADEVGDSENASDEERQESPTHAQQLIALVIRCGAKFFHSDNMDRGYVRLTADGHVETWSIYGAGFKRRLRRLFYKELNKALTDQVLADVQATLNAMAVHDGEYRTTATRVGGHESKVYLDLCDSEFRAVEISSTGFSLVPEPPVIFERSDHMKPLPAPEPGATWQQLRRLLNVTVDDVWLLLQIWIVGVLNPWGPCPILCVNGEQGSGKTILCRILRRLIDPFSVELRSPPRTETDLVIAAKHSWIVAFDNLSYITDSMSDALCRVCTGGGTGGRKLYTDDEESLMDVRRPILINGIGDPITRPDLIDRTISVELPRLTARDRRTESEIWEEFERSHGKFVGTILDAVVIALATHDSVKLDDPPRMADFMKWVMAASPALGTTPEHVLSVYHKNHRELERDALESNILCSLVQELVAKLPVWTGTASKLLDELRDMAEDRKNERGFPRQPNTLSNHLKRMAPALRTVGIEVSSERQSDRGRARVFTITNKGLLATARTARTTRKKPAGHGPTIRRQKPQK